MFFVPFISSKIFLDFLMSNRFRFRLRGGVLVEPVSVSIRAHAVTRRFESLDAVDLTEVLQFKASIRQKAPKFLHRTYKAALRQAIDGVKLGWEKTILISRSARGNSSSLFLACCCLALVGVVWSLGKRSKIELHSSRVENGMFSLR